jgi:hypothetical protein
MEEAFLIVAVVLAVLAAVAPFGGWPHSLSLLCLAVAFIAAAFLVPLMEAA